MTNLERRALLGDAEAQKQCTKQGIVLPCPFCGGQATVKTQKQDYGISGTIVKCSRCLASVYCLDERAHITDNGIKNVPVENHRYIAIHRWNARPAPPIGKCGQCAKLKRGGSGYGWCNGFPKMFYQFCDKFEPKEAPNNA